MHIDIKVKVAFSRSGRFWTGLSSDLVIEQTLMRSVKSTGGPIRGSNNRDSKTCLVTFYAIHG